jgi:selenocysteine lyase/cysteine desulfurase
LRKGLQEIKGVTISSPLHPALAGAMVSYGIPGISGEELQDQLWSRKKYRVRSQSGPFVRQSLHYYNSPKEVDGTLEVVRALAS